MFAKKKKPDVKKTAPATSPILAPTESLEGSFPPRPLLFVLVLVAISPLQVFKHYFRASYSSSEDTVLHLKSIKFAPQLIRLSWMSNAFNSVVLVPLCCVLFYLDELRGIWKYPLTKTPVFKDLPRLAQRIVVLGSLKGSCNTKRRDLCSSLIRSILSDCLPTLRR